MPEDTDKIIDTDKQTTRESSEFHEGPEAKDRFLEAAKLLFPKQPEQ